MEYFIMPSGVYINKAGVEALGNLEGAALHEHTLFTVENRNGKLVLIKRTTKTTYLVVSDQYGLNRDILIKGTIHVPMPENGIISKYVTMLPGMYDAWFKPGGPVTDAYNPRLFKFDFKLRGKAWTSISDRNFNHHISAADPSFRPDRWEVTEEVVKEIDLKLEPGLVMKSSNWRVNASIETSSPVLLGGTEIGYYVLKVDSGPRGSSHFGGLVFNEELTKVVSEYFGEELTREQAGEKIKKLFGVLGYNTARNGYSFVGFKLSDYDRHQETRKFVIAKGGTEISAMTAIIMNRK